MWPSAGGICAVFLILRPAKLQEKKMNDPELEKPMDTSEVLKEKFQDTEELKSKLDENMKKLTDLLAKAKK